MSNDVTLDTLAQRLVALERQNRRLKQTFAVALVGALVVLAAIGVKAQVTGTTVAADRLSMVDANGTHPRHDREQPGDGAGQPAPHVLRSKRQSAASCRARRPRRPDARNDR